MILDSDMIEKRTESLKEGTKLVANISETLSAIGSDLGIISTTFYLAAWERDLLYKLLLSLLMDSGIYEYSINADNMRDLSLFKLEIDVNDNDIKFRVKFPEQEEE